MVQMNLYAKQKQRHRHREQTFRYQAEKEGVARMNWEPGIDTHIYIYKTGTMHKIDRLPSGTAVKNPPANEGDAGDVGSIPGSGRSPGEGNGNLLQHSCWENSRHRGAWRAAVHRVTESQT